MRVTLTILVTFFVVTLQCSQAEENPVDFSMVTPSMTLNKVITEITNAGDIATIAGAGSENALQSSPN